MSDEPSDEERKLAQRLGYNPGEPDTWPMETIHRLIAGSRAAADEWLTLQIIRLMHR